MNKPRIPTPRTDALADRFGNIDPENDPYWQALDLATKMEQELSQCGPSWRKCKEDDEGTEVKGVHFLKKEAVAGGEVAVLALHEGEFYEIRFKVPPFATDDRDSIAEEGFRRMVEDK